MKRFVKGKISYFLYGIILVLSVNIAYSQNANKSFKLGKKAYYDFNYKEAISYFSQGTEIYNDDDYLNEQTYYFLAKAVYYNSRNDYKKSISFFDKVISSNPKGRMTYFLKAKIIQFENNDSEIVSYNYKKVLQIITSGTDYKWKYETESQSPENIILVGVSILNVYGKQAALKFTRNGINSIPSYIGSREIKAQYYYLLSIVHAQSNEREDALESLDIAFKKGLHIYDYYFPFIDFYNLRDDDEFKRLMVENKVPESYYNTKPTITLQIEMYVQRKINTWQKKGKFEKTKDYQARVNESNRYHKIEEYTRQAIDSIGISNIKWNEITNEYDADNESFRIELNEKESVFIAVPISDAPSFDKNFKELEFNNISFALTQKNTLEMSHLEITNPDIGKTYVYDSDEIVAFNSSKFNFSFDEIEVPLNKVTNPTEYTEAKRQTRVINVGKSDVDTNIPITGVKSNLTLALIIGNEDYSRFQTGLNTESNVDFAQRDAEIFSQYANKTLGIPSDNITLLVDATSVQMQREIEKLSELAFAYEGEANILFYYAGHGFPDEETKESYLMPVDVSGADVRHGIKLNYLYEKLTKYPSKKVIVVLDACFSGGGRNQGLLAARGVQIKPKENVIGGNLVIMSSSTGEQSSLPYANKQHGMFTYFLLKKLKETKGEISLEALSEYVSREVSINSLKMNSKKQNPTILISPDVGNLWMDWKLN